MMNGSIPSHLQRIASHVEDHEFDNPDFITVIKVIWHVLKSFRTERAGWIIGSAFILLMLWGTHGKVELLNVIWPAWPAVTVDHGLGPSLIPGMDLFNRSLADGWWRASRPCNPDTVSPYCTPTEPACTARRTIARNSPALARRANI